MKRTNRGLEGSKPDVLVDLKGLQMMLNCGRMTAQNIAKGAEASVIIGRRHLYNVQKIQNYLDNVSR